jgi:hypothetical protein
MMSRIQDQIDWARKASESFRGGRDWERVQIVCAYLVGVERLILLSLPVQAWILVPEPAMKRLREAALRLNERWAQNLALEPSQSLVLYP